jgi:hypothetical protein
LQHVAHERDQDSVLQIQWHKALVSSVRSLISHITTISSSSTTTTTTTTTRVMVPEKEILRQVLGGGSQLETTKIADRERETPHQRQEEKRAVKDDEEALTKNMFPRTSR